MPITIARALTLQVKSNQPRKRYRVVRRMRTRFQRSRVVTLLLPL
jgi:hypothetical protein